MAKPKVPKEIKVALPAPEVESTKTRTFEEIQREYSALAAKCGQFQYQVYTLNRDLDLLNNQMRDLNFEAAALKGKEQATNG